jgi:Mg-chelatase subunit ChlD
MRNDSSVSDDWTAATTMETKSFVNVGSNVGRVDNAALDFVVTPRHVIVGMESNMATTQACVTITACEIPDDDDKRAPVDIVVALDVSTSMYGKKLELCKRTLEMLLRILSSKDQFALISYGSNATVEIPARNMTNENKEMAFQ